MADTPPANADVLMQLFAQNPPKTALEMRQMLEGMAGFLNADLPEVGDFQAGVEVGPGMTTDVVVPRAAGPHPVLVYLHGGGWVAGSPATHCKLAYRFAEAGYLVFNVDYRLAPEHPFPTPYDDCVAALRWAQREAGRWGGDPARLAVGGDSAGGNLSAAAACALADDVARPKAALLIYGVFDFATIGETEGVEGAPSEGPLAEMGQDLMEIMVGSYLGSEPDAALLKDPRVSPIHCAAKLPPSHVVVGSADPLVLQARALVEVLKREGVEHELFVDEGMPHGYAQMEMLAPARPAIDRMVEFLRKHV